MVRKWEELTFKEQTKALEVNVEGFDVNRTCSESEEVSERITGFIQIVSTGPYYFDKQGIVYTAPAVTQCPPASQVANRIWKYDYKTRRSSVVTIAEGLKQRSDSLKQEQA